MSNKNSSLNIEKTRAIIYIIYLLLKGEKLSTKEMSDFTGKNQRTCERYVKEIEQTDLPIRKEGTKYYFHADDGYLPFYLTKEKINMIYIALISFSAFGDDLELVNQILEQLQELVPPSNEKLLSNIKNNLIVKRRYEIIQDNQNSSYEIFMLLLEGYSYKRSIKIKYKGKRNHEYRTIDVYGFCLAKETYYINAFCHEFNKILMFRIDRITECSLEDRNYLILEEFNLNEFYKYTWEVENSRQPFDFEILFCGKSVHNIKERKCCENQSIIQNKDGSILFRGTTSSEIEFKKWILSFGCDAKVIEPTWLRKDIKSELELALKLYK